jgi:hypothetical protein
MEEFSLEEVELRQFDTADFGIVAVCTEGVTKSFAGDGDGGDDKAVHGKRRDVE